MCLKQGQFVYVDLGKPDQLSGHEQAGVRPAIIMSSNAYNAHNNTVMIAPITTKDFHRDYATSFVLPSDTYFHGKILLQHLRAVDTHRINVKRKYGRAPQTLMIKLFQQLNHAVFK